MSPAPAGQLWLPVDWDAPDRALRVADAFLRSARARDPVQLAIPTGALDEEQAAERLVALLQRGTEFTARAASLPDVSLHEGGVPEGLPPGAVLAADSEAAVEQSLARLHELRRELAPFVALTPVMDREEWARELRAQPGFHHLAVDNASRDGTVAALRTAGAEVVVNPAPLGRLANWRAALDAFAEHSERSWARWLFAGDDLLPNAADVLQDAVEQHPEARLVVTGYLLREPDGRELEIMPLPETRLLWPADALALSAARGNWFGPPTAVAVHREAVADAEFGALPWVADWQACLAIATRHPVLFVATTTCVFDVLSRRHYATQAGSVGSLVQELALRVQAVERLKEIAPHDVGDLESRVHVQAATDLAQRVGRR